MNTDYRALRASDADEIVGFLRRVGGDTDFLPFSASDISFTDYLFFKNSILCGAIADGHLVAVAEILMPSIPRIRHTGTLILAADKSYWGTGIAQHLFEFAREEAKEKGIGKLQLSIVDANERGKAFARRNGFISEGSDTHMMYVDGQYVDGERFCLIL